MSESRKPLPSGRGGVTFIPIPRDRLTEMVGRPIHLAGAPAGCVWLLERIDGELLHLLTPKTRRPHTANADRALYTRRHQPPS